MPDVVDAKTRSRMMSGIRGKNTKPEILVRKELHKRGFRFRVHVRSLPGTPDIVLPRYRAAIFINGCFWHHHDCHLFKWPSSRPDFWRAKIERTEQLDRMAVGSLQVLEWRVLTIWECSVKGKTRLPIEEVINQTVGWLLDDDAFGNIEGRNIDEGKEE